MGDMSSLLEKVIKERDLYLKRGLELAAYPHQSKEIDKIYAAFAQAQGEFPSFGKGKQGYGYKYADLTTVLAAVVPILSKHGLFVTHFVTRGNMQHTRLAHTSGQWFESQYPLPVIEKGEGKKNLMQENGSNRTYIKRYELSALLGISPDEDTDGV